MNFLQIPEEVMEKHIFPFLTWNDLLRFRRVCDTTYGYIMTYINIHTNLAPELEINEEDKNLSGFLEMGIPTTKLFLNNKSGYNFYKMQEKSITDQFLLKYSHLIKCLRVTELSMYLPTAEYNFLNTLTNLVCFKATRTGIGCEMSTNEEMHTKTKQNEVLLMSIHNPNQEPFPENFRKLKKVEIGPNQEGNIKVKFGNMMYCLRQYLQCLPDLDLLSLPFQRDLLPQPDRALQMYFTLLTDYIQQRVESGNNLKTFDFINFHENNNFPVMLASPSFLRLCLICMQNDIKLANVSPEWFIDLHNRNLAAELKTSKLGIPIVSLVNVNGLVFPYLKMPNLQKIEVRAAVASNVSNFIAHPRINRPDWPDLKIVDITVFNSKINAMVRDDSGIFEERTRNLFQFFFRGVCGEAMVDLRLNFEGMKEAIVPKSEDIVSSCPNLRKLCLRYWPGTNKAISKLWRGLTALEEVSLEYCTNLGNVAFVGEDRDDPVFLKLKNLRKLSLKGLDKMPKITDTLLSLVIRYLNLSHFILTSDEPVESITPKGIQGLLDGQFANSIEAFSFRSWSVVNSSVEDWVLLEKQFRSFDML